MAKAKRVTVRLDDELDAIINQACADGSCGKTSVILSAIRRGLDFVDNSDSIDETEKPTPKGRLVTIEHGKNKIPLGQVVKRDPVSPMKNYEIVDDDGTRTQYKDGKLYAQKKPGGAWRMYIE
jgi:hypothetical protein